MYIVYKAFHNKTGKFYIGYTSFPLEVRIGQHWGTVGKRRRAFQLFLQQTKMEEWTWSILAKLATYQEAKDCEMYHIRQSKAYEEGLNLPTGIGSHKAELSRIDASKRMQQWRHDNPEPWNKGRKGCYSEETLAAMRLAKLKNPSKTVYTEEMKKQKSLQATNSTQIIELKTNQIFNSISAAARHFGLRREAVRDVVNGKRGHTGGFVFQKMPYLVKKANTST